MGSLVRSCCLILALFVASACGGRAKASGASPAAGGSMAGSAAGGSARQPEPEPVPDPPALDDVFPWFDGGGQSGFPMGQADQILTLIAVGTPARATLSTHNHTALLSYSEAIEFSARATAPTRLLVSASNAIQAYDYFAALEMGTQWPVAPVEVGLEWQDYSVQLSEMRPVEMGDADGIPSFWLAFIVEHPEPVEVSLDEVRLRPRPP